MKTRMWSPAIPSQIFPETGTTVFTIHADGATVFQLSNDEQEWIQQRQYNCGDFQPNGSDQNDIRVPDWDWGEFRVEIDIRTPIQTSFDFVADIETHSVYADFVDDVKIISNKKQGEGVVFQQKHKGREERFESEFIEYEPNTKLTWVVRKDRGNLYINYFFKDIEKGTKVVHSGISPIYDDLKSLHQTYENNVTEMEKLKKILECDD